ncbi:MAG: hypothetical protein E6R13_02230 [Spirochaetes bacterium]|nr:MAG: hypothetical protein E6R13_02230 [Spirochaetota bacterium]
MINITAYDPRAIDSPYRGSGFRSYDAKEVETLIEKTDFKTARVDELLWELDKLCKRAYMPGFSYMLDIYFSCGMKVLYAEGIDFIQHCAMWGKELDSFDFIILKPQTYYSQEFIEGLNFKKSIVIYTPSEIYHEKECLKVSLFENIVVITTKEDTLIIDFSHIPVTTPKQNNIEITLHTKLIQPNYPEELPKYSPGITSI